MPNGVRAGVERAMLALGAFHYFLGAMIGLVGYFKTVGDMGGANQRPSTAVGVVLLILIVGVIASSWTAITITWFNRPRFLVPPHLRDQPGTMAVRRRHPAR